MHELSSYLLGAWNAGSGDPRTLHDPSTEAEIAAVRDADVAFADVVAHARDVGGPALRALSFAERAAMLKQLSEAVHGVRDELIELSARNGGSTRGDAKFDIDGATGTLAAYASLGKRLAGSTLLPDGEGVQLGRSGHFWGQHVWTTRPGVAVHINAFNFPCWGMAEKLAQAILAGVPVITKPGTPSAWIAWRHAQAIVESGVLPEGALQFVCGGVGDLLEHLGPMDGLSFTGSSGTGARLKGNANLVRRNVRVTLEADSLNAAIVGPDVDDDGEVWPLLLDNLHTDMTQKAGQKCTAVRRILVPEGKVEMVVEALVERLTATRIGNPADADVRMGPVASAAQFRDVRAGIETLLGEGCKAACGGAEPALEKGYFVAPTLLVAPDADSVPTLHAEEVFGPVATIVPYSGDADDAIAIANRGGGGLVAALYSDDRRWSEAVVTGIGPWHGRVWMGSEKVGGKALQPGMVLPMSVHGGPGRAGGGEELGGLRGLEFYMQRTAVQGYQGLVSRAFGPPSAEA